MTLEQNTTVSLKGYIYTVMIIFKLHIKCKICAVWRYKE